MSYPQMPPAQGGEESFRKLYELQQMARRAGRGAQTIAVHRELTEDERKALDQLGQRCMHCQGYHDRACPRVKRLFWHPNGLLARVDYWPDDRINWEGVVWSDQAGQPEDSAGSPE